MGSKVSTTTRKRLPDGGGPHGATVQVNEDEVIEQARAFIQTPEKGSLLWGGYFVLPLRQMRQIDKLEQRESNVSLTLDNGLSGSIVYKGSHATRQEITVYFDGVGPLDRPKSA